VSIDASRRLLAFASVVETGTGLVLMLDPAIVVRLLLGAELTSVGAPVGRCFGIALLALGLACWPKSPEGAGSPPFRAMAIYNLFIASYLGYLGAVGPVRGMLPWPAVALHGVVGLLLVWTGREVVPAP
jgi:hypothetical protein